MEDDREELRDVVLEELKRLGVNEVTRKKSHNHVTQGSKLLGINTSSNVKATNFRSKTKIKKSPRQPGSRSPLSKTNNLTANRTRDERKHKPRTPKSPFSTSKRKAEQRKQNAKEKVGVASPGQVFGQKLENVPSVCVYMTDGTQVTVPEFLVDVCNLIRRNITVEGIFRKAGSSQRQSDLKKLIDSSSSLPSNVHVIDGACLLKQFLRCFPEPLLPSEVHSKIIRCMELTEELKVEAVILCTLLLPEMHRHTLIYLLDFLLEVATSSELNLMDAHNLAIVLAPNLLPTSITPSTSRKNFQSIPSEDAILTTNIEVLQLMIENASQFCRMPSGLALALEHREKSKSTENLLASQPNSAVRKKRRSASIHRLMTGLRRVVGHSSTSGSPLKASESVEYLDTLHQHPGIALSPAPMSTFSPRKRKSADAFDLCTEVTRDAAGETRVPTPPSSKRVRVESEDSAAGDPYVPSAKAFVTSSATTTTPPVTSDNIPMTIVTHATPCAKQSFKMGQPFSIREVEDTWDVFPQSPHGDIPKSSFEKSIPPKIRTLSKSPGFSIHSVHNGVKRRSVDRIEPIGQPKEDSRPYPRAYSELCVEATPVKKTIKVKRRSCDVPLGGGVKRAGNFEEPNRVLRRNSFDWRSSGNEPDGADVSRLGPRGIPDGAECNLRDSAPPKPSVSNSLESLEQHYDDIKAIVQSMEAEVDKTNVQQMKETYFANSSSSSENMSYSEMIQNAYERMKVETKELGVSPSQSLSKRLGKELKIRNRRSSEHRVIRSPSERKIGTIRRRSRELVQTTNKSINVEDTPKIEPLQTPRMKEHLLQTPVNGSLRRGKPNSVKSGLPLVVCTFSPLQKEEDTARNSNRTVIISKRSDDNTLVQPLRVSGKSPYRRSRSLESSTTISDCDLKGSLSDLSSLNISVSKESKSENLMDSITELLPGAITRRRSSLLSSLASSFPILKIPSSESLSDGDRGNLDSSSTSSKTSHEVEHSDMDDVDSHLESKDDCSSSDPLPVQGDESGNELWVPATDFSYTREDEQSGSLTCETGNGRPSLAALMKQRKVTANVQLFNNLHTATPVCSGNGQLRSTPKQGIPPRSTASDRRNVRLSYSRSLNSRSTLTPRELLKARQRSFQFDKSPRNLAKIAVVSPLKESTWINIQQEHAQEVPKAFKGEATIPQPPLALSENSFKPPVAPVTPVRPHNHLKIFRKIHESPTNPPKLPPRNMVKPSPIRVQYR